MATCDSLQHIFDKPLPENPSLLESLSSSWKQIKPVKPIDHSFTELFGELHFKETTPDPYSSSSFLSPSAASVCSSSSSSVSARQNSVEKIAGSKNESPLTSLSSYSKNGYREARRKSSDSFSTMNRESLQLCTEGLGFESLDDVEDLRNEINSNSNKGDHSFSDDTYCQSHRREEMGKIYVRPPHSRRAGMYRCSDQYRRAKSCGRTFPPPISSIGRTGKPWVCFKSYRHDGRFVLQEVRTPTQEFLHACREDGRLRLALVQSDDHLLEEEEEEEEDEDEDEELEELEDNNEDEETREARGKDGEENME